MRSVPVLFSSIEMVICTVPAPPEEGSTLTHVGVELGALDADLVDMSRIWVYHDSFAVKANPPFEVAV